MGGELVGVRPNPCRGLGGYLDPIGWGVSPLSASGGCHPAAVGRFLKIGLVWEKMRRVNGFEGGGWEV